MIGEKRLALADPVRSLGAVHRLIVLPIDIPIAMTHGPGDAYIGQAQDFVLLRVVVRFAVAGLAQSGHSIHLILVR
ncbi:hypothetical protein D3C77_649420 [compost metagenome]